MSSDNLASRFGWFANSLVVLFGLLPGGILAMGALFLLPNISLVFKDNPDAIAAADQVRHYLTFSTPILGYAAMIFAFVAPRSQLSQYRLVAMTGLAIGVSASGVAFVVLADDLFFFLGHLMQGTRLPFNFVERRLLGATLWAVMFGGLITVGLILIRQVFRTRID